MHTIISYIIRIGLGSIGIAASRAVSVARSIAWVLIELVLVVAFLYIVAFLSAGVGMMVVERAQERTVDTIKGVNIRNTLKERN